MSIILKGIDLPKGNVRTFRISPSGAVMEILYNGKINNNNVYQAIQIPKGHGRLKDADRITLECQWCSLDNTPTILEAETED